MPQPWPFKTERVSADTLRERGITPDPSWRYDRATNTYSRPVLRDNTESNIQRLSRQLVQESAAPTIENLVEDTRRPEKANLVLTEATNGDGKKVTRFKCVVAQVDIVNRNGKLYPRSAYEAAITAAQEDMDAGRLWALCEHADDWMDPMKGRLEKIAGRFDTLTIEGDLVMGGGIMADTGSGKDIQALFNAGIAVGISTSGTATVKRLPAKELGVEYFDPEALIGVIQDDFRLLTIDFVSDPANPAGLASKEARRRLAQEGSMHPKIKALLEKYNLKTVDELKASGNQEAVNAYYGTLEDISKESVNVSSPAAAPAPAPANGTISVEAYRTLESTVVELRSELGRLTQENHNSRRDGIALSLLEGARLPSSGTVKYGESVIDLDASFKNDLVAAARAAESDEAARAVVETKIAERRAVVDKGQQESRQTGANRLNIPTGDNSRTSENKKGDTAQLESTRRSVGLI